MRLFAGHDPVTGQQVYLRATIAGTDDKARRNWVRGKEKDRPRA